MTDLVGTLRRRLPDAPLHAGLDTAVSFEPWNVAGAQWPLARIECASTAEVSAALRIAADHGVALSVAGAREDVFGRNSRSGRLVIDLRRMSGARFERDAGRVCAQGGASTRALVGALPDGVVAPTAVNAGVGVAGAATGGGYGMLCGRFGLACDALEAAELVLASGEMIVADAERRPEVFWALRGGGTGFGVVTALRFRTHPCPSLVAGETTLALATAAEALATCQELIDRHGDALTILPLFTRQDGAEAALTISTLWCGEASEEGPALASLRRMAKDGGDAGKAVRLVDTLDAGQLWPWGQAWSADTLTLPRLTAPVAEALVAGARAMPTEGCVLFLHDFHGHAARVPAEATAFNPRRDHFVTALAARARAGEAQRIAQQRSWMAQVKASLSPSALPGGYINFLPPDRFDRVAAQFGVKVDALGRLKDSLDPQGRLSSSTGNFRKPAGGEPRR